MISSENVMITGVGGGGLGEQLIKALRLSSVPYKIIGTDITPLSKGLLEADVFETLPRADDSGYIGAVLELCEKYNVKAIFYGSEAELQVLSDHREVFASKKIFLPINSAEVIKNNLDKIESMACLQQLGFKVPRYHRITSLDKITEIDFLPAVLKPSRGGGGSANVMIAQTPNELRVFGELLLDICSEFIVQEYIGDPQSEYTAGVLHSMDGELINSIAVRRQILNPLSNRLKVPNKTNSPELGELLAISSGVSQGYIGRYPVVTSVCERISKALDVRGAVNIQCRIHNDEVYIFEINPRFSGTTSLRAMVGYNEPDILYRHHVLGEPFTENFEYESGYIARGLSEGFIRASDER